MPIISKNISAMMTSSIMRPMPGHMPVMMSRTEWENGDIPEPLTLAIFRCFARFP